ncbi:C-4 methylsterol oxidase, putative, partial [Paecilomyces variotii No. 5]
APGFEKANEGFDLSISGSPDTGWRQCRTRSGQWQGPGQGQRLSNGLARTRSVGHRRNRATRMSGWLSWPVLVSPVPEIRLAVPAPRATAASSLAREKGPLCFCGSVHQAAKMNSTTLLSAPPDTYWGQFEEISKYNVHLNVVERLWAAWYAWMQNDVLATGIMSFVMHELVYFGRSLPWVIVDSLGWFRKYKIQSNKVPSVQEQWDCAKLVLLSHFTVELPQIWLFHPMAQFCGLQTSVPFPSIWTMAYQIAIFFVLEDTWHYFSHRAFHWGPLYKAVHKIHHQYSAPFGLAAEYASPIEVMALGFGTVGCPILWCAFTGDLHIVTMYIWIVLRLFQAIDAHSGYEFPWSLHHFLPFWAGADHHDLHHEKFIGNYSSSFRWWDYLLDTEYSPESMKRKREQRLAKAANKSE